MNPETLRELPRDSVFYSLLRSAMSDFAKANGFGRFDKHFSDVLGYASKTGHIQLSASLSDVGFRKFSIYEFSIVLRELGTSAASAVNRLLEGTGLVCIPSASASVDVQNFSVLHLVKSGELAKDILAALEDGKLSKDEKLSIHKDLQVLLDFLVGLRDSLELYNG